MRNKNCRCKHIICIFSSEFHSLELLWHIFSNCVPIYPTTTTSKKTTNAFPLKSTFFCFGLCKRTLNITIFRSNKFSWNFFSFTQKEAEQFAWTSTQRKRKTLYKNTHSICFVVERHEQTWNQNTPTMLSCSAFFFSRRRRFIYMRYW